MRQCVCLYCSVVMVSTMPHGSIFSCPKDGGGHKPLNSAATKCYTCPVIPSARNREVWGLLAAEPAFAFAGTRNRSVTVRSGGYEPPFCQYGGGTVAAVRKTNNFLCLMTRPFIRTQKRPHFALTGKMQAFLMLTFSDWRWLRQPTRCVQQYITKEKVGPFWYVILYLGNPAIGWLCAVQRICLET